VKLQLLFLLYSFIQRDHFAEGKRLYELNRFEEGLASFDMAIKHDPTNLNAFTGRGVCLHVLKRLDEALASYDMAIKQDPTFTEAFFAKGICLRDLNRLEEALAVNDMALKHNPNNSLAIKTRKDLLERLKSK
jgi:tetratricopeptide (TPR) repeat protein